MKTVEIYGRAGCGYCERAKLLCEIKRYPFAYIDTTGKPPLVDEMFARAPDGARSFPQIFIGRRHIGGYDDLSALSAHEIQQMIGE